MPLFDKSFANERKNPRMFGEIISERGDFSPESISPVRLNTPLGDDDAVVQIVGPNCVKRACICLALAGKPNLADEIGAQVILIAVRVGIELDLRRHEIPVFWRRQRRGRIALKLLIAGVSQRVEGGHKALVPTGGAFFFGMRAKAPAVASAVR